MFSAPVKLASLVALLLCLGAGQALAFKRPIIISTGVDNVQKTAKGVSMDLRILMRNDNGYPLTIDKGAALLGLEGYRVGAMQVKQAVQLPPYGMEEVVLTLAGNSQQRRYIAETLRSRAIVGYAYKGYLSVREFADPIEIKEVSRFRVPARLQQAKR
jgi:LEA14-like dessication related protein